MTPIRISKVTSKGTTRRSIRVDDTLWEAALAKAERQGFSMSELLRSWMANYVDKEEVWTMPKDTEGSR